ncbi:MAG: serine/threonine protein kinase [Candidatus Wallbacteria bacterium]|nr:serine/threonine protein kinase [Candidatus Wallbacteria bacterium]
MDDFPAIPGYKLLERMGTGAFGTVFRALQESLDREVAVKLLLPAAYDRPEARARFQRETHIQARLAHPNLVGVLNAGFAGDVPYLVAEFVPGGTLRQRLERGHLALPEALRIGRDVAAGLACAHESGVIHRDLKPENILFGADSSAKISDFGLARLESADDTRLTVPGQLLGTPGYTAPEVFAGQPATAASDVFALGIVVYEVVAGQHPLPGGGVAEALGLRPWRSSDPLSHVRSGVPPAIEHIVEACLDRDPTRRPSAARVRDLLDSEAAPVTTMTRQTPAPPSSSRRVSKPALDVPRPWATRALLLLAAAAAVAMIARGVLRSTSRAPATPQFVALGEPGDRPQPPPGPELESVSAGTRAAHVWFGAPASRPMSLRLRRRGRGTYQDVALSAGTRDRVLNGLEPGTEYVAELIGPAGARQTQWKTCNEAPGFDATLLDECPMHPESLQAATAGSEVRLLWRRSRESKTKPLMHRRSRDGGLTWDLTEQLSPVGARASWPAVAHSSRGWFVAWTHEEELRHGLMTRYQANGETRWSAPGLTPGDVLPAAVQSSPGGGWDILYATHGTMRLGHFDFPDPATRPAPSVAAFVPPAAPASSRAARLFECGDWTGACLLGPGLPTRIWAAGRPLGASSPWSTLKAVTEASDGVLAFDAAAGGGRVAIVYTTNTKLHGLAAPCGDAGFTAASFPGFDREVAHPVAVAPIEDGFLLACFINEIPFMKLSLALFRSPDGNTWKLARNVPLPNTIVWPVDLQAVPSGSHVVVFCCDMNTGLWSLRLPWP